MTDQPGGETDAGSQRGERISRFIELINDVYFIMRPNLLEAWSEIELTFYQFMVLSLLSHEPRRIGDIAALLGIRLSSATSMMDRMEARRLVERVHDPQDRRVVWCRLTPLGIKEAENIWNIKREWLEQVASPLTDQQLQSVVQAFETLSGALVRQTSETSSPNSQVTP